MTARLRRLVPLAVALWVGAGASVSCVNDLGPDSRGRPVSLALNATVTGLSAAATYTMNVQVSYQITGGGSRELPAEPSSFTVAGGDEATSQAVTVVLAPCLNDPDRIEAESDGCRLSVTLILGDEGDELARATQDLGLVHEGDVVEPPQSITMTPSYTLTITGGGPATGSGTVTAPAAGDQAALSCQITDGQAAATGCSGRYPLHTPLVLTATNGSLAAWEEACSTTPATGPCELAMDGHRTVKANFAPAPTTGELEVHISGLPAGIAAQVTVANGSGFNQTLTASGVLTALQPGDYTVTASPVTVPAEDRTYSPEPEQQPVAVAVGQRATAQVAYNPPETGSLAVAIVGLPEGTPASVTVTGPNDFIRSLAATETLAGLEPGSYTVEASSVTSDGGQTYDPIVAPHQPISIQAGTSATVTVTYNVPPAAKLVFTQQPATTDADSVIKPAVTVEIRDAQDRPVLSYPTPVTISLEEDGGRTVAGLGGTTTVTPQNALATFNDLTVDRPGRSYTLVASSGTLPSERSDVFRVTSGTPIITSVDFPGSVSNGPGVVVLATVGFIDPRRDITRVVVTEIADPNNVYTPRSFAVKAPSEAPDVVQVGLWVCSSSRGCPTGSVTVDLTLEDVDGNASSPARVTFEVAGTAPVITAVNFPAIISASPGASTNGTIDFVDPDGDIVLVDGEVVSCVGGTCGWTDFDPRVSRQTSGSVSFFYSCTGPSACYSIAVTLRFVLVDFAGNRSAPVDLSFRFEDPPVGAPPPSSLTSVQGSGGDSRERVRD